MIWRIMVLNNPMISIPLCSISYINTHNSAEHNIFLISFSKLPLSTDVDQHQKLSVDPKKCNRFDLLSYREIDVITSNACTVLPITHVIASRNDTMTVDRTLPRIISHEACVTDQNKILKNFLVHRCQRTFWIVCVSFITFERSTHAK